MSDPRAQSIDVGPVQLDHDGSAIWTATGSRTPDGAASAAWGDWVALAHRILQTDALWREREARGDAWDQGHAASGNPGAENPYR